eukprot:2961996-Pleurochrysis_carterae.AAC.1
MRSVPTAARTTSSVYMRAVCMRASSSPRCCLRACNQARVAGLFGGKMPELEAQECKEDHAEALGIVGGTDTGAQNPEHTLRRRQACHCAKSQHRQAEGAWPEWRTSTLWARG